ncbi:protein SEED AND ROOT HAIR PROTECTIVE PROTEIN-like [Nicotiana tomentosiformis]|uniref:protein SEED AND ROOT HAIR PROTECTIVE PROTEIN-like n=1 Tax=Nicotiana tomentosiformis TaxID=4098 RepID=UPI00051AEF81|nr:pistil-specific extensin-like protein [Nicotiana tomentosiformis]
MASSNYLPAFCILLFLVAATNIAFASSSYGNGHNYGYENAPKSNLKKHLPTKGLIPASIIAVQGMIYCKSGSKLIPLKGAVARITCLGVEKNGYETAPFSFSSYQSDSKGYYYAVFSLKEHKGYESCKITQCKAFLESSSLEECDVPTDENKGKTGALLTSYRFLNGKNTLLYSVAPFVYTSDDSKSNYQGEGY